MNPIRNYVLIEPFEKGERVSESGIVLAGNDNNRIAKATVIATGAGKLLPSGSLMGIPVSEGDVIFYMKQAAIKIEGEKYQLLDADQIVATD